MGGGHGKALTPSFAPTPFPTPTPAPTIRYHRVYYKVHDLLDEMWPPKNSTSVSPEYQEDFFPEANAVWPAALLSSNTSSEVLAELVDAHRITWDDGRENHNSTSEKNDDWSSWFGHFGGHGTHKHGGSSGEQLPDVGGGSQDGVGVAATVAENFFSNTEGMHVVGKKKDLEADDDDPVVWVYQINVLKGWAETVAVIFTVITVLLIANQIGLHLEYNEHPGFRTYTVRILLLVPIYSLTSYAGLHNPSNAIVWALIRDCYECVVLFSFLQYCLTYLGGPENLARYMVAKQHAATGEEVPLKTVDSPLRKSRSGAGAFNPDDDFDEAAKRQREQQDQPKGGQPQPDDDGGGTNEEKKKSHHHHHRPQVTHAKHPPLCWLMCPCCPVWRPFERPIQFKRPWALGAEFVRLSLLGTLQYIPCSLIVTAACVMGKLAGVYHEGNFSTKDVYLYAVIVRNWSQCWALYCLGLFYVVLHDELSAIRPVLKFSVIKIVVLVMWWQGVLVNVLEQQPQMKEADDGLLKRGWTSKEVGFCIQNFLCIIEMLFIGIGFHYAFHYTEWASPEIAEAQQGVSPLAALWRGKAVSTVKDVLQDANTLRKGSILGVTYAAQGVHARYAVSKETRSKNGGALSTNAAASPTGTSQDGSRKKKKKTRRAPGGGEFSEISQDDGEEEEEEEEESGDDDDDVEKGKWSKGTAENKRKLLKTKSSLGDLRFVTLPRLITSQERKSAARLITESVNFMDIFRALREINMLDDDTLRAMSSADGGGGQEEEPPFLQLAKKRRKKKKKKKSKEGGRGHGAAAEEEANESSSSGGDGSSDDSDSSRSDDESDKSAVEKVADHLLEMMEDDEDDEEEGSFGGRSKGGGWSTASPTFSEIRRMAGDVRSYMQRKRGLGVESARSPSSAHQGPSGETPKGAGRSRGTRAAAAQPSTDLLAPRSSAGGGVRPPEWKMHATSSPRAGGSTSSVGTGSVDEDGNTSKTRGGGGGSRRTAENFGAYDELDELGNATEDEDSESDREGGSATEKNKKKEKNKKRGAAPVGKAMLTIQPLTGDPLRVAVSRTETVFEVKVKLHDTVGYPPSRISLSLDGGHKLANTAVAAEVVPAEAVVHLTLLSPQGLEEV